MVPEDNNKIAMHNNTIHTNKVSSFYSKTNKTCFEVWCINCKLVI